MTTTPQLLPLHIAYDGPAPVDTYFQVKTGDNGDKVAAFRGRAMHGVDLVLPDGYAGVVLHTGETKDKKGVEAESSGGLVPGQTFEKIGLWRADVDVDPKSDEYARALDEWTRMATLVHAPDADEASEQH